MFDQIEKSEFFFVSFYANKILQKEDLLILMKREFSTDVDFSSFLLAHCEEKEIL